MERPIKTRSLRKPYLAHRNKFIYSFICEFDGYLYQNPEVRLKAGLTNYRPQSRSNEININFENQSIRYIHKTYTDDENVHFYENLTDEIEFDEADLIFITALSLHIRCLPIIKECAPHELLSSSSHESEINWIESQWIQFVGNDKISHARFVYKLLHNQNIPKNITIPLLKGLGIENSVILDKDLSESNFVSKYGDILYLPIDFHDNNISLISKLLKLMSFDILYNEFANQNGLQFISNLDEKSLYVFSLYYTILKKKYPEDYSSFVRKLNDKLKQEYTPSITFLKIAYIVDEGKYIIFDNLFNCIHNQSDYEVRSNVTAAIINLASLGFTPIYKLYEHFCSQNKLIPKAEILGTKHSSDQADPKEEFVSMYKKCHKDKNDELHLGLSLDGDKVYNLYNVLINGYIDASQTSLEQFCYALTGMMRPEKIEQLVWLSSIDELAILVNRLFHSRKGNKPQTKICKIFTCKDSSIEVKRLTSKCCRAETNKCPMFFNRLKAII